MTEKTKHAREMTDQEADAALRSLGSRRHPSSADRAAVKTNGTNWELIASNIRAMSIAELHAFEDKYGISIDPNIGIVKPWHQMTPSEKARFQSLHKITPKED